MQVNTCIAFCLWFVSYFHCVPVVVYELVLLVHPSSTFWMNISIHTCAGHASYMYKYLDLYHTSETCSNRLLVVFDTCMLNTPFLGKSDVSSCHIPGHPYAISGPKLPWSIAIISNHDRRPILCVCLILFGLRTSSHIHVHNYRLLRPS